MVRLCPQLQALAVMLGKAGHSNHNVLEHSKNHNHDYNAHSSCIKNALTSKCILGSSAVRFTEEILLKRESLF
jgi:hypothetical protein